MSTMSSRKLLKGTLLIMATLMTTGILAKAADGEFGPNNPFYAPSPLPFQAPPFDKIKERRLPARD